MNKNKNKNLCYSFRLNSEVMKKFDEYCEKHIHQKSKFLTKIVLDFLNKNDKK